MSPGWIGFIVGIFVGANLGLVIVGLLTSSRCNRCAESIEEMLWPEESPSLSSAPQS